MPSSLTTTHLCKEFHHKKIVNNFCYQFTPGCYAVCGPNGSGKSTLLKLLSGIEKPDAGEIHINGIELNRSPRLAKHLLTYVPESPMIYPYLTGREFLSFIRKLRAPISTETVDNLLENFLLQPMLEKRFSEMSQGVQKKFFLTAALIYNTPLLLLDEPTNALDESAKHHLTQEIMQRQKESIIICATHDKSLISVTSSRLIHLS